MDSSEGEGEVSPDSTQAWKIDSRTPSPQQASRSRSRSRSSSRSLEPTQAWKVGSRTPSPQPGSRSRSRSLESTQAWKINPRTQTPQQMISRARSLSRSRSRSLSRSRSRSLSRSRSKSVSRSKSRQLSRSMSRSRSKSESPARSPARSTRSRSSSASISRSRFGRLRTSRSASLSASPTPVPGSSSRKTIPESSSSRKTIPESSSSRKRIRQNRSSSSRSVSPQGLRDSGGSGDEGAVKKSVTTSLGLDVSSDEEDVVEDGRADIFKRREAREGPEEDSDDDILRREDSPLRDGGGGNDFEMMMTRKRQENKRRQKKKDIDVINENDDAIAKLIADMRIAAKEDRDLNNAGQPATKKMAMFQRVMCNLKKGELRMAFVEANLLSVMTDWLAPMPDKGLPHVHMRTAFLKLLQELRIEEPSRLKESGIGKAVMYLYRHPRETRDNKVIAGHIINAWARPIFRKEDNFAHMSREDRRERDDAIAKRRGGKKVKKQEEEKEALKPGDPGWVSRARVPMPDAQEYIKRPDWQNDAVIGTIKKKKITLLEKHKRKFAERRRAYRTVSMTKISIEGARMNLGSDGMNVIH